MIVCICPYFPVPTFIAASVRPGGSSCISSSPIAEPRARDSMPVTTSNNTFRWWKNPGSRTGSTPSTLSFQHVRTAN
ncbi:putative ethyl tert-butyl ether degradation EthD [Burkholderia cepacia]|nr:putative ethyl tert-butyl ether degradation EthD [Burkholderia cepacia]